ncbi:hypothetical protein CONLIGDRAFT_350661 [Coniochaeta ligniaria NRRL 30616]|uniref:Uncharacterized protein n=1 Tax=Coniochaeta ligniaria NRRL 30616 TaxID=1408157 RepID=A0A1J7JQ86_9PEZI|nr:hypothetical protein CONLIGDRAFT_350661 [Coniochaeta ligniaria NRRL 30616]
MTKMALGPSLPQARGANTDTQHQHNHRHLHSHIRARRHHHHSGETVGDNHIRSHEKQQQEQPHQRDAADLESNLVTEVVQTVSVVQVVDGSGSPIEIKTYFPDSAVQSDNSDIGPTAAGSSIVDPAAATAALPSSDGLPSETAADLSTASTLLSSLSDSGGVTSAPSSTFTSFPSLSGVYNATSRPSFFNSTANHSLFANTTTASIHSNTSFSFSLSTTSHSSSTLLTSTTEVPTITVFGNGGATDAGAGGVGATLTALPTSTSTESSSPGGALDPTTSSIVGGIVGGFAGIALVVLAVLIAVKWKRQHGKGMQLLTEGDGPDNRGPSFASHGGPGGPGGPGGVRGSWAIPAALASLTGYKRASQATIEGPETSEKGFYRVSGRKLTSVLQSGGDGYGEPSSSDIRASTISGASFYRPDSIAMFSDAKSAPLQLGSPMRPESGIMIMRSGPARTPVEEQGPVFDDTGPLTPPALTAERDPLGRSLLNQSGSGASAGSPSRFTEVIR